MKRPAFMFYPGDWLRDTALMSCSMSAQGLWIKMICLMHEGTPYGHLKVNNKVILPESLARMTGLTSTEIKGYLEELEEAGVFSRDGECIVSRRMIRDEEIRNKRAEGGKMGGNPALMPQKETHKDNHRESSTDTTKDKNKQTPSVAVASSVAVSDSNPIPSSTPKPPDPKRRPDGLLDSEMALAMRLAGLFGRRESTTWKDSEVKAFRKFAVTAAPEDIDLVVWFYGTPAEFKRQDLGTLLNNFSAAIDRAKSEKAKPQTENHNRTVWSGNRPPTGAEIRRSLCDPNTNGATPAGGQNGDKLF